MGTACGLSDAARIEVCQNLRECFFSPEPRQNLHQPIKPELFDQNCYDFMVANRHALIAKRSRADDELE
jgi:hypothetical protein